MTSSPSKRSAAAAAASDDEAEQQDRIKRQKHGVGASQGKFQRVKQERLSSANGGANGVVEIGGSNDDDQHERDESDSESERFPRNEWEDEQHERDESDSESGSQSFPYHAHELNENVAAHNAVAEEEKRSNRYSVIPESGIIKGIHVVNFMNHTNWSYNHFGAKLNFIVGRNGSGKSAILTALSVALGGKASNTGRGSSVKDMIKRGADKASITLTLTNRGRNAYKPDKYKDQIIIQRTLDRSGSSGYKIRATRDGPILATKKHELDSIVAHFGIDVDSPMTVLTQEKAKSFLASADARELYKFFLAGCGLKELQEQYAECEERIKLMVKALDDTNLGLASLEKKANKIQNRIKLYNNANDWRNELDTWKAKLLWCNVFKAEKKVAKALLERENLQKKLRTIEHEIDLETRTRTSLEERIIAIQEEGSRVDREMAPISREVDDLKREIRAIKSQCEGYRTSLGDVGHEINLKKVDIDNFTARANAGADENAHDPREMNLRQELERRKQRRSDIDDELGTTNVLERQSKVQEAKESRASAEDRRTEALQRVQDARRRKDTLSARQTDPLAPFGTNVKMVLDQIDKARWRERPIGPLGQYVKLKDFRYRDLVQRTLGGLLCSFATRYPEDEEQLKRILQNCLNRGYRPYHGKAQMPQIMRHHGDMFDFSSGDLSRHAPTMLSILDITNEVVLRLLIAVARVETLFVVDDKIAALQLTDRLFGEGLSQVQISGADGISHTNIKRPDNTVRFNSSPIEQWRFAPLFTRDTAGDISALQRELDNFTNEYNAAKEEYTAQTARVHDAERTLQEANRQLASLNTSKLENSRRITEIEDELLQFQAESVDDLQELKDAAEEELRNLMTQKGKLEQDIENMDARLQVITSKHIDATKQMERHHRNSARIHQTLTDVSTEQVQAKTNLEHRQKQKEKAVEGINKMDTDIANMNGELQMFTDTALRCCERFEFNETQDMVERKIKSVEKSIEETERQNGMTEEQYRREVLEESEYRRRYKDTSETVVKNRNLVAVVQQGIRNRKDLWGNLRSHYGIRVCTAFYVNLYTRGFDGDIHPDHEAETLTLTIDTTGDGSNHRKTANRLSGGERSYSTVCFLLAMWSICPNTMACLDEWDVFLDSVNRVTAGKMIIDGANSMPGKQFILITPLDMSGLPLGEHCKIIRMGDPERNQLTLG